MIIAWILAALGGCLLLGLVFYFGIFLPWGLNWGSTKEERAATMVCDKYLAEGPAGRKTITMTRAITIGAPPEKVWPWLAQLGRGAGYYTWEYLDNGGKASARHIVSWIPELALGDSTGPGYIAHIEPGRSFVLFLPGFYELGNWERLTGEYRIEPEGEGTRLVCRIIGEALGWNALAFKWLFAGIDTLMNVRQLWEIKKRVEKLGVPDTEQKNAETGAKDQYQHFEVIYASGERAGVAGKENAAKWFETVEEDSGELLGATEGSISPAPHPLDRKRA